MIPFPDKKYSVIYADPPWEYKDNMKSAGGKWECNANDHYPTMLTKDICDLPVLDISDNDCLLFLWVGSPLLDEGIAVGKAWGFKYKQVAFVWDKQTTNAGSYTITQCELCLVFKKGKIPQPRGKRNIRQFISCKKGTHSVKPLKVRECITEMFPTQAKIELFARPNWTDYDRGWDFWGNEV